ncbi:Lysophospholipase L1 [Rubritalea squalenifaciens DSM 18772]|uniref:Lysophospholipase L1 n=1 Tax=Rubritalea squalenifaciens DSM 18772 TaxID=1123071 RepID=A0A1M6H9N8_9BACT|nr:SGNH/GDSL hydrolase family protein [Rubritalea squalenifaciens]SHJ18886.1 Lysophospholipase L1 [Rubritalea squalenifaciens DSM 18772]
MKSLTKLILFASILLAPLLTAQTNEETPDYSKRRQFLVEARRIVFLGDSITYQGEYVANFDTWLHAYYPKRKFDIIDLGLPSETVSGLSEKGHANGKFPRPDLHTRLDSVLEKSKPDLIFACYGMNCGIQQPFDEERFQKYKDGILKLKTKAEKSGAKIIFITPPYYDSMVNPNKAYYTEVLAKYSAWLMSQTENDWNVIDLNTAMTKSIMEKRKDAPKYTVQKDAVHPNTEGHWFMTQPILSWFGDLGAAQQASIQEVLSLHRLPASIAKLTLKRMKIKRDAWLTYTGHERPGIPKGMPLEQAEQEAKKITHQIQKLYKVAGQ